MKLCLALLVVGIGLFMVPYANFSNDVMCSTLERLAFHVSNPDLRPTAKELHFVAARTGDFISGQSELFRDRCTTLKQK